MASEDDITTARLNGTAGRLVAQRIDQDAAVAELRAISSNPTLLAQAGGRALGSWRRDEIIGHGGDRIAGLLLAAGADADVLEQTAVATCARLSIRGNGIGNPS